MSASGSTTHAVNVRGYLVVFGTLLVLTMVTVSVASLNLSEGTTVLVAVSIAAIKATLVATFFMHLKSEKPMVFWPLGLTAVLFVGLFASVLWSEGDHLFGTKFSDAFGSAPKASAPASPKSRSDEGGGH
jgi:cytochrome c oxidase subunit 4